MSINLKSNVNYTGSLNQLPGFYLFTEVGAVFGLALSVGRQLNGSYLGPAMRVRRSSDNTEQDIPIVDGVPSESALLTFVGPGDGFVTVVYDQSGFALNATQTTAAAQPRIVLAGVAEKVNGKLSMFFDGVDDFLALLDTAARRLASSVASFDTFCAVQTADIATTSRVALNWTTGAGGTRAAVIVNTGAFNRYSTSSRRQESDTTVTVTSASVVASTSLRVLAALRDFATNTQQLYQDDVLIASGATGIDTGSTATNTSTRASIGVTSNGTSAFWSGHISEVLVGNSNQAANRSAIDRHMMAFYGVG